MVLCPVLMLMLCFCESSCLVNLFWIIFFKDFSLSLSLSPVFFVLSQSAIVTEYRTNTVSDAHSPHFCFFHFWFFFCLFPGFPPWHGSHRSLFRPSPQRVSVGIRRDYCEDCESAGRSSVKFASRYEVMPTGRGSLQLPAVAHSSLPAIHLSGPPAAAHSSPRSFLPVSAPAPDQESSAGSSPLTRVKSCLVCWGASEAGCFSCHGHRAHSQATCFFCCHDG